MRSPYDQPGFVGSKRFFALLIAGIAFVLLIAVSGNLFEQLDADEIMVIQSPISGELTWHTEPGLKWQGAGYVTKYPRRLTYSFGGPEDRDGLKVRFNDGGHGFMHGSIQFDMPKDVHKLSKIHMTYGNQENLQKELLEKTVNKAVYLTGPLMSSKESYAERRADLVFFIEDQVRGGVYKTRRYTKDSQDPITQEWTQVVVTEIEHDPKTDAAMRQEDAAVTEFGLSPFNFNLTSLPYDEKVEKQIETQQDLTMRVQTAKASKLEAEQRATTAKSEGEANAMRAKWEQEVLSAKAVTLADQERKVAITNADREKQVAVTQAQRELEVATLGKQAASQEKERQILLGQGESERRRLVMAADGALPLRLNTWLEVNTRYASALQNYKGSWVPSVVMGSGGASGGAGGDALALINMMMAKTAKDLAVDFSPTKQ
jgi:hypothetical protein